MRTGRTAWWVAALLLSLTACSSSSNPPGDDGGGQDGGADGDGDGEGGGEATEGADAPVLSSVTAQVAGRTGRDLAFVIKGRDADKDIVSLWVRFQDANGNPVPALDTNRDGAADASEGPVTLGPQTPSGGSMTAKPVVRGIFAKGVTVGKVVVVLKDATNLSSAEKTATVAAQPVKTIGQTCDTNFLTNRCAPSLGCRGTSPTCQEGLAPTISRLAFYKGTGGPTILVEGTEPEDDLDRIRFEFRNASNQSIAIDMDGDGTPDATSTELKATGEAVDGAFFLRMQAGEGLDLQVPKLVAIGVDEAEHAGAEKSALPIVTPVKNTGQACDVRGFDVCKADAVCSPGILGEANKCASAATLRTNQCRDAPVLVPTPAGATVIGVAEGASFWDSPAGCSTNDPKGRPEGIVTVRLAQDASRLTLTTARPSTGFDTTLYVLPGCPATHAEALGCSDDAPSANGASTLVLTDVPAGDYTVVVDSFDFNGGVFELQATLE